MLVSTETPKENAELQVSLEQYVERISEAEEETITFRRFRDMWPTRFLELCKLHLAVLIDLPTEFYEDHSTQFCRKSRSNSDAADGSNHWWAFRSFSRLRCNVQSSHAGGLFRSNGSSECANNSIWHNLMTLIDLLDTDANLSVEGIFRKPGNVTRQRVLKQRVLSSRSFDSNELLEFDHIKTRTPATKKAGRRWIQNQLGRSSPTSATPSRATVHDMASALKGVLYDLPEPVLTQRLLPLYIEVAGIVQQPNDERGVRTSLRPIEEKIMLAKQLKALRLLRLLLPDSHAQLLKRLLDLLQHALEQSSTNRMSADSLGTLFSPSLLCPSTIPARELPSQYQNFSNLISLMISQGYKGMSLIPTSFLQDIRRNQRLLDSSLLPSRNLIPFDTNHSSRSDDREGDDAKCKTLNRSTSHDSGLGWIDASRSSSETESFGPSSVREASNQQQDLPPLVTCISFAVQRSCERLDRTPCPEPREKQTEFAVAELCATIQAMADTDPRKRRLVQRFNASNGGLIGFDAQAFNEFCKTPVGRKNKRNHGFRSCSSSNFIRTTSANSAFKAAKTIRSSLRRKLNRNNEQLSTLMRLKQGFPDPLIESRSELDGKANRTTIRHAGKFPWEDLRLDSISSGLHPKSPIFDAPPLDKNYSLSCPRVSLGLAPKTGRISLVSLASNGNTDVLLCCPLMGVIPSPFRKRPDNSKTMANTPSSDVTPIAKRLRSAKKRVRCRSPSPVPRNPTPEVKLDQEDFIEDSPVEDSYFPILFDEDELPAFTMVDETPFNENTPHNLSVIRPNFYGRVSLLSERLPMKQKNLHDYGYRTISRRNLDPNPEVLRRCHTMPSLLF